MSNRPLVRFVLVLGLCLVACGAPAAPVRGANDVIQMEETRVVASRSGEGELVFESYDAGQLFERGTRLLNEGRCADAIAQYYERLVREFPTSRYVPAALYNSGLCLQERGELEAAIPHYQRLIELAPQSRDGRHGALQLAQVFVNLEHFADALPLTERILLREDLEPPERLEALARRAQALLGLDRIADAASQARDALSYYRTRRGDQEIREPYFAAAANFVLAETLRMRSEAIALPPGDALSQHEVLDQRARLVLDAQREYFNTIRYTDAQWAAASGYRIGSMYDRLWQALMEAPIPPPSRAMNDATLELYRREYRAELARHIRPLIRHAIRYWELTLMMVERTGVQTEWAERTRTDLDRMRALLIGEERPADERSGEHSWVLPRLRAPLRTGEAPVLDRELRSVHAAARWARGERTRW